MRAKQHSEMPRGTITPFKKSLDELHTRLGLQKMRRPPGHFRPSAKAIRDRRDATPA